MGRGWLPREYNLSRFASSDEKFHFDKFVYRVINFFVGIRRISLWEIYCYVFCYAAKLVDSCYSF